MHMDIHFLGHSEFILEIPSGNGRTVNLLCDSWLSDYAFGDFMARNPAVKINAGEFQKIDGIFISHPHCDHLDPYTLVPLFKFMRPDIIIPESMLYLTDLFNKYLDNPNLIILRHNCEQKWKGISLTAYSFTSSYNSNEDDVMPLLIETNDSILFHEVDRAVPDTADAWNPIYKRFKNKKHKNRIYIATRNELEALFTSYDAKTPEIRKKLLANYRERRKSEMEWEYEKFDSGESDFPELWKLPDMIKIFTGQGMIHSPELFPEHLKISAPFPLDDILKEEKKIAAIYRRKLKFAAHRPGMKARIHNGNIAFEGKTPYLESFHIHETSMKENIQTDEISAPSPVFNEKRNANEQKKIIENILQNRFFPFHIIHPEDSLKDAIHAKKNKKYVIEILFGTAENSESCFYSLGLSDFKFSESVSAPDTVDESYWANDLEDYISGKQDMFSTTFHTFKEGTTIRLWTSLGFPYLNSDLVHRKINFHFNRACENKSVNDWFFEASRKFHRK